MLHITNGDCAVGVIAAAGIGGEILPWRDVLHEGPVPGGLSAGELAEARARFIASCGWGAPSDVLDDFTARDNTVDEAVARGDEIVLWFEHDLYDQLQLIQVLDRVERCEIVCEAEYLGTMTPERAGELFAARRPVTPEMGALARAAWAAFRSPNPLALERVASGPTGALPFLGPAIRRHLEELPSVANGLSRSEAQALTAIAGGRATVREAYPAAHHEVENPIFLGDAVFVTYLDRLSRPESALVHVSGEGAPLDRAVAITPLGRAVLEGREDWVALGGVDRWLGGVRLAGPDVAFRWDSSRGCVEARR